MRQNRGARKNAAKLSPQARARHPVTNSSVRPGSVSFPAGRVAGARAAVCKRRAKNARHTAARGGSRFHTAKPQRLRAAAVLHLLPAPAKKPTLVGASPEKTTAQHGTLIGCRAANQRSGGGYAATASSRSRESRRSRPAPLNPKNYKTRTQQVTRCDRRGRVPASPPPLVP